MVQDIEDIRPKLHFDFIGDGKILHPGHIPLEERRAAKRIASDVSKRCWAAPDSVEPRLHGECVNVVTRMGPTRIGDLQGLARY